MATVLRVIETDPEQAAAEWIMHAQDAIIGCRGQGHAWPKLKTGKQNSKYVRIDIDQKEGVWQLVQICRDCGKERVVTTQPQTHDIDLPAKFRYRDPEGYKAPKGIRVTRRACFAESWRRSRETLALQNSNVQAS